MCARGVSGRLRVGLAPWTAFGLRRGEGGLVRRQHLAYALGRSEDIRSGGVPLLALAPRPLRRGHVGRLPVHVHVRRAHDREGGDVVAGHDARRVQAEVGRGQVDEALVVVLVHREGCGIACRDDDGGGMEPDEAVVDVVVLEPACVACVLQGHALALLCGLDVADYVVSERGAVVVEHAAAHQRVTRGRDCGLGGGDHAKDHARRGAVERGGCADGWLRRDVGRLHVAEERDAQSAHEDGAVPDRDQRVPVVEVVCAEEHVDGEVVDSVEPDPHQSVSDAEADAHADCDAEPPAVGVARAGRVRVRGQCS